MKTLRQCNSMREIHTNSSKRTSLRKTILRLTLAIFLLLDASTIALSQAATIADKAAAPAPPSAEGMKGMIQSSNIIGRLETSTTPAFHLKARFETFDYLGKPDGSGSIDSFWDGTSRFRRVMTYRDHTRTEIHAEKTVSFGDEGFSSSLSMSRLISRFFNPLPSPEYLEHSDLSYKPLELPGGSMDCIIASVRAPLGAPASFHGEQNAYCLNKDSHALRLAQMPPQMTLAYNDLTAFHAISVPRTLTLMHGSIVRGRMHVEDISDWTPDNAMFRVPEGADELPSGVQVSSGVVSGFAIKHPEPDYPLQAKQNRITGSVVLRALISRTGDIRDLEIVSSPDPSLSDATVGAVRKWKYKPYLLNGKPVEVDTMITVNFNAGRPSTMMY